MKQTTFRLEPDLLKAASDKCKQKHTTLSDVIRRFLRAWVAGKIKLPQDD